MNTWRDDLLELADRLTEAAIETVVDGLDEANHWFEPSEVAEILTPHLAPKMRKPVTDLLASWREARPRRPWSELGIALETAHQALARARDEQSLELVWTGPDPKPRRLRLTEPVLFELVEGAQEDLLLVSYSVSRMEELGAVLKRAADRGVTVTLVLEGWEGPDEAAPRLEEWGSDPREYARVLTWPPEARLVEGAPVYARLHAKCAVADRRDALVTSANLSRAAHRTSMELGIRVTGGVLPGQIREHFRGLEVSEVLKVWS